MTKMKNRRRTRVTSTAPLSVWLLGSLLACSTDGESVRSDETGGNTSWLSVCAEDAECDGVCEGGVCSKECGSDGDCAIFGTNVGCLEDSNASGALSCGDDRGRAICLPTCSGNTGCAAFGAGFSCASGFCQPTNECSEPATNGGASNGPDPTTGGAGNPAPSDEPSEPEPAADDDVPAEGEPEPTSSEPEPMVSNTGSGGSSATDGGASGASQQVGGANSGGASSGGASGASQQAGGASSGGANGMDGGVAPALRVPECPGTFERCDSTRCRDGELCLVCPDGQLCVEIDISCGPQGGSTAQCVDDPCAGSELSCACADSVCSAVGTGFELSCNVYNEDSIVIGPSGEPFMSCNGGGVCASPDTSIATPNGDVLISQLAAFDLVYSLGDDGIEAVPLLRVARTRVLEHTVLGITLDDGSHFEISGPHPTADGRRLDQLAVGEELDGRRIVAIDVVPYAHAFTYDILPASKSGSYVANGVWMGTTLAH